MAIKICNQLEIRLADISSDLLFCAWNELEKRTLNSPFTLYISEPTMPSSRSSSNGCFTSDTTISKKRRNRSLRLYFTMIQQVQMENKFQILKPGLGKNVIYMAPSYILRKFPLGCLDEDLETAKDQQKWRARLEDCETMSVNKEREFKIAFHFIAMESGLPSARMIAACDFILKK